MQTSEPLTSWKAIAAYLGCDERTAQRWESECGLPVHRTPGRKRGSIFAFKHELDEWLRQGGDKLPSAAIVTEPRDSKEAGPDASKEPPSAATPARPTSHRKYFVGIGAVAALILIGVGTVFFSHRSAAAVPAKIAFTTDAIQAFDGSGRALWAYHFSKPLDPYFLNRPELLTKLVRIADIRGNGNQEVLVSVPLRGGPNSSDFAIMEIDCFSIDGRRLWSYVPKATLRFGSYDLRGPWWVTDIFISTQNNRPTIWAALGHYEWGNSFVVQLDPVTGNDTMRFVNTGIIDNLNEIRATGKTYLLAGGFNNEYESGSLAVIDESKPFTVSPQTSGTRHKCVSCPEGAPDYYFVFPRSEINLKHKVWENFIQMVNVNGDQFEVWKMELGEAGRDKQFGAVRSIYLFHTVPFRPYAFRFDSGYDMLHSDFQHQGKLDHGLETCPERLHPQPVRVWTPTAGWSQIAMSPIRAVD
jgi:hypothetical protein